MFENRDALLKEDKPIQHLLWQFEQTPIECKILPEEISVKNTETNTIHNLIIEHNESEYDKIVLHKHV